MVTSQRSTPETCPHCGVGVDGEHGYRRHLHDAHDPSELGRIDRRRYEQYSPQPSVLVQSGTAAATRLAELQYPVEGVTMARYAAYGLLASLLVATALGVGL